jgi:hypothetical protein
MTDLLHNLIEALREELKQYGEMLALLEQQQAMLVRRATHELLDNVGAVHAQGMAIQAARHEREQRRLDLSRHLTLGDEATFGNLIHYLPAAYQPLVEALVEENNELIGRIQRRAGQNHLLLCRALELMQQFIASLAQAPGTPVYNDVGTVLSRVAMPQSHYDAVG